MRREDHRHRLLRRRAAGGPERRQHEPRQLRAATPVRDSARHRAGDHVPALSAGQEAEAGRDTQRQDQDQRLPRRRPRRTSVEDLAFLPVAALATLVRKREVSSTELTQMYLDAAQEARAGAQLRRHAHRGARAGAGRAGGQGDQGRDATGGRCTGFRGARRISSRPRASPRPGARSRIRTGLRLRRHRRRAAARRGRGAGRQAVARRAGAGRQLVSRADQEPVEPGARDRADRRPGPDRRRPPGWSASRIGTETRGSIISPSAANGVVGLRPTYGRVSRYGAMALSWTMDKIGPMCRSVEDCALVFNAIYGPDGRDDTVVDAPFEWNPGSAAVEAADRLRQDRVRGAARVDAAKRLAARWRRRARTRPRRPDAGTAARAERSAAENPQRGAGRLPEGGRDDASDRGARRSTSRTRSVSSSASRPRRHSTT